MTVVDPVVVHEYEQYCKDCPLRAQQFVVGRGYTQSPAMVIGTAPGTVEEVVGLAFSGKTGTLVRQILESLGVTEEEAYFTNVMKRRPTDENGKQRKPNKQECFKCGSHLVHEIVRNRPRAVLALGSMPLHFLIPPITRAVPTALSTVHGLAIPVYKYAMQLKVIPTYDLSHVQRNGGLNSPAGDSFLHDLEEFARIVREY